MTTLRLPFPPTANNLYKNVRKGRARTEAYDSWLASAYGSLRGQQFEKVVGSYRLQIVLSRPDRRARDADNLVKAISDFLKKAGVIQDDAHAQSVFIGWAYDAPDPNAGAFVSVEPAEFPIFVLGRAA